MPIRTHRVSATAAATDQGDAVSPANLPGVQPPPLTYQPLTREHFPLLAHWLAEPLVARWWHHETSPAAVERDFGPSIDGADVTELFLVALLSRPIGLVQRYPIAAYPEYVDEFASVCPLPAGALSIDYLERERGNFLDS